MSEGTVLVGRLPSAPPLWEPMLVTTLRRFHRRGASARLLLRLAGGARAWRLLNDWWDIDGSVRRGADATPHGATPLGEPLTGLSADERRIALAQIADQFEEAGRPLPAHATLAAYFGVSCSQIVWDFGVIEHEAAFGRRLVREARR